MWCAFFSVSFQGIFYSGLSFYDERSRSGEERGCVKSPEKSIHFDWCFGLPSIFQWKAADLYSFTYFRLCRLIFQKNGTDTICSLRLGNEFVRKDFHFYTQGIDSWMSECSSRENSDSNISNFLSLNNLIQETKNDKYFWRLSRNDMWRLNGVE